VHCRRCHARCRRPLAARRRLDRPSATALGGGEAPRHAVCRRGSRHPSSPRSGRRSPNCAPTLSSFPIPIAVAWTFTSVGRTSPHTPLPMSFAIVPPEGRAALYLDGRKLSNEVRHRPRSDRRCPRAGRPRTRPCGTWAGEKNRAARQAIGSAATRLAAVMVINGGRAHRRSDRLVEPHGFFLPPKSRKVACEVFRLADIGDHFEAVAQLRSTVCGHRDRAPRAPLAARSRMTSAAACGRRPTHGC